VTALTLSASGHGPLPNKSAHVPPAAARRPKKTQGKKTKKQPKKTCCSPLLKKTHLKKTALSNRPIYCTFKTAMTSLRQEAFKVGPVMVVTAVVNPKAITTDEELVHELRAGVTKWARTTKEGRAAYDYSADDMNIGDLSSVDLKPILANCPNIISLDWEQVNQAENWEYDTPLCDDIE
jgi:hypothetical protein